MITKVAESFISRQLNNGRIPRRPAYEIQDDDLGHPLPGPIPVEIINTSQPSLFTQEALGDSALIPVLAIPGQKYESSLTKKESLDETNIIGGISRAFGRISTRINSFTNKSKPEGGFKRTITAIALKRLIREGKAQKIYRPLTTKLKEMVFSIRDHIDQFNDYNQEINFGPTGFEIHHALNTREVNAGMLRTAKDVDPTIELETTTNPESLAVQDVFLNAVGDTLAARRTLSHWSGKPHNFAYSDNQALYELLQIHDHMSTIGRIENYEMTTDQEFLQAASVRPDMFKISAKNDLNEQENQEASRLIERFNAVMENYKVGAYLIPQKMTAETFSVMKDVVAQLGSLLTLDYYEVKTILTYAADQPNNPEDTAKRYAAETLRTGILTLFNLYKYSDRSMSITDFISSVIHNGGIDPKVLIASCPIFRQGANLKDLTPDEIDKATFSVSSFQVRDLVPDEYQLMIYNNIRSLETNLLSKQKERCIARILRLEYQDRREVSEEEVSAFKKKLRRHSLSEIMQRLHRIEAANKPLPIPTNSFVFPFSSIENLHSYKEDVPERPSREELGESLFIPNQAPDPYSSSRSTRIEIIPNPRLIQEN